MGAPIPLRKDCNGKQLRGLAYRSGEGSQSCRLLALAAIYDGQDRTAAARVAGVETQIIRKWVLRFNAQGPEGLKEGKAEGPAHKLNQQQREALAAIVESGPDPRIHGVVRWRLCDLVGWIKENFPVSMVETTVGRELRRMGYVKLSARPRHYAQDKAELEAFKKTSPAHQGNPRRTGGWRRRG